MVRMMTEAGWRQEKNREVGREREREGFEKETNQIG